MLKITNMDKFIKNYGEEAYNIINKIYSVFHSHAVLYLGDIYTGKDVIIWKEERPKMVKEFKKYIAQISKYKSKHLISEVYMIFWEIFYIYIRQWNVAIPRL